MDTAIALLSALAAELLSGDDLAQADRLALSALAGGTDGAMAALNLAKLLGEAADPAEAIVALTRVTDTDDAGSAACLLVMACFAAIRADYPARPEAIAARERIRAQADAAYAIAAPAGADVIDWLVRLAGETVLALSSIAASRAPLVRVETGVSLPSTLIAYDLYGDAGRAGELVDRNRASTPIVMPVVLEAIAPST